MGEMQQDIDELYNALTEVFETLSHIVKGQKSQAREILALQAKERKIRYNDTFDPDEQYAMEKEIAKHIFDMPNDPLDCDLAGKEILRIVLRKFRPDLFSKIDQSV